MTRLTCIWAPNAPVATWAPRFRNSSAKTSTSGSAPTSPNLLFGPGSNAWSFTVTPTYQYKNYFVRAELAYVTANKYGGSGAAYGTSGDKGNQTRGLIETGVLF